LAPKESGRAQFIFRHLQTGQKGVRGIANNYAHYIKALLVIILIAISFFIIKPFLVSIITGALLAYIFYPLYRWMNRFIKNRRVAAFLLSILLVLLVTIPMVFILNAISQEAFSAYLTTKDKINIISLGNFTCSESSFICTPLNYGKAIFEDVNAETYFEQTVQKGFTSLRETTIDFLIRLPSRIFAIFIIIFVMYYLFIDGQRISDTLWNMTLLKKKHQRRLKKTIQDVSYGVIYGSLITALTQGIIASIGYLIFGISSPILWGLLTAVGALIPFVGTAIIWVPLALYDILMGLLGPSPGRIGHGIGLFIYGLFLISTIDNILKPKLIGDRGKVHPIIVLIGVFGGLKLFSFIGIILGPLMLSLTISIVELYQQESEED